MGRKLKNEAKKTAMTLDTGFRTIMNGPLFIIYWITYAILKVLSFLKFWVILLAVTSFVLIRGYERTTHEHIKSLSDFFEWFQWYYGWSMENGAWRIFSLVALVLFVSIALHAAFRFIRVKMVGDINLWALEGRMVNNEMIKDNDKAIEEINKVGKFDSKKDYLKDVAKNYENSVNYKSR